MTKSGYPRFSALQTSGIFLSFLKSSPRQKFQNAVAKACFSLNNAPAARTINHTQGPMDQKTISDPVRCVAPKFDRITPAGCLATTQIVERGWRVCFQQVYNGRMTKRRSI